VVQAVAPAAEQSAVLLVAPAAPVVLQVAQPVAEPAVVGAVEVAAAAELKPITIWW
jgi:hypothetical protein